MNVQFLKVTNTLLCDAHTHFHYLNYYSYHPTKNFLQNMYTIWLYVSHSLSAVCYYIVHQLPLHGTGHSHTALLVVAEPSPQICISELPVYYNIMFSVCIYGFCMFSVTQLVYSIVLYVVLYRPIGSPAVVTITS